ncbi:hypothetical protein ACQJBY_059254 [Aegilops geniculata]
MHGWVLPRFPPSVRFDAALEEALSCLPAQGAGFARQGSLLSKGQATATGDTVCHNTRIFNLYTGKSPWNNPAALELGPPSAGHLSVGLVLLRLDPSAPPPDPRRSIRIRRPDHQPRAASCLSYGRQEDDREERPLIRRLGRLGARPASGRHLSVSLALLRHDPSAPPPDPPPRPPTKRRPFRFPRRWVE